jgi:hypothetical protein
MPPVRRLTAILASGVRQLPAEPSSHETHRWRETDSNLRFLVARPSTRSWETGLLARKWERICWGTGSSNPSPSSAESAANLTLGAHHPLDSRPEAAPNWQLHPVHIAWTLPSGLTWLFIAGFAHPRPVTLAAPSVCRQRLPQRRARPRARQVRPLDDRGGQAERRCLRLCGASPPRLLGRSRSYRPLAGRVTPVAPTPCASRERARWRGR